MEFRLRNIREDNDLTQEKLAKILGVKHSVIGNWENEKDTIPLERLNTFCNYFQVSMDYVCKLTNNRFTKNMSNKIDRIEIGKRLKRIRKEHNDTQQTIAQIIGIDRSNYSRYELGKNLILTSLLIAFCKHYNISMDFICYETNTSKKESTRKIISV